MPEGDWRLQKPNRRPRGGALISGTGLLLVLIFCSPCAQAADSRALCSDATLHGNYVYAYTGYTGSGSTLTRFAVAGLAVFNGDGTSHGIWTTTTEGQPAVRQETFKGTYTI